VAGRMLTNHITFFENESLKIGRMNLRILMASTGIAGRV
jgi:hypothetical protein